ncbi:hypothetical protein FB45DRAFT_1127989 [Roridomyces roridus]|uniref:F-box domain-containing protein n=1 Tax=Roridomyces roridus TaxID=1738132 RepID=A0AAD7F8Q5_9AGAR|nr:hypothetical protein FB45DRAFT_1127989 [Roridomyces roridus]
MTSICSECGVTKIAEGEPTSDTIPATPETLAGYQRLATSNEPPNNAERAFLQAVASKSAVRLTCLDEEISRLEDRLGQLEAERAQLAGYHSQNVAILSPLRRMPHELLAEIFLCSVPSTASAAQNANVKRSPWVLGRVSRRWRAVSLSTPSLWSTVCVDYRKNPPIFAMIQPQVERASARMLKIDFRGSEAEDCDPQIEMLKTLSKYSDRWEELWIQLTVALTPQLDRLLRGRLPSLRKIHVQYVDANSTLRRIPSDVSRLRRRWWMLP